MFPTSIFLTKPADDDEGVLEAPEADLLGDGLTKSPVSAALLFLEATSPRSSPLDSALLVLDPPDDTCPDKPPEHGLLEADLDELLGRHPLPDDPPGDERRFLGDPPGDPPEALLEDLLSDLLEDPLGDPRDPPEDLP